jgi:hypothetical protein
MRSSALPLTFGPSVLDTYKQSAQPNIHAGFQRF